MASSSSRAPFASRGGSSKPTCITCALGKTGHASCAESQTVITRSNETPISSGLREACVEISIPTSAIARIASGLSPCGCVPAEYASIAAPRNARANPSAIWLRQLFPVQRKRTRFRSAAAILASIAWTFFATCMKFHFGHRRNRRRRALLNRACELAESLRERLIPHAIGNQATRARTLDDPRARKHFEMARDHRKINDATRRNFADKAGASTLHQTREQLHARWISKCLKEHWIEKPIHGTTARCRCLRGHWRASDAQ